MADIRDLISACSESEIFIQILDENIDSMTANGKVGKITFLTDPQFIQDRFLDKENNIGFVVWLPKDIYERLDK